MMNSPMLLRSCLCCFLILSGQGEVLANSTPTQLARQVVDQLMNIENEKADATIQKLEIKHPDYPLLGFMKISPLWAKAESTYDDTVREKTLNTILGLLSKSIESS